MSRAPTEKEIESYLCREVKRRGGFCLKLALLGLRGFPDRTILLPVRKIGFAELKTEVGKLSAQQKFWIKALTKIGFPVAVVRTKDDAVTFLTELKGDCCGGDTTTNNR